MKSYKNKVVKTVLISILLLFIVSITNNSYGYQIRNIVIPKEELGKGEDPNFPELLYKKQVSAYPTTIINYNNRVYPVSEDRWVYVSDMRGEDLELPSDNTYTNNNEPHNNAFSFERYYEYIHKYQNSEYTTQFDASASSDYKKPRYYTTGEIRPESSPKISYDLSTNVLYNVWGESNNYSGVYWQPASQTQISGLREDFFSNNDILLFSSNLYRFAVDNGVYVSDNFLTENTVEKLWDIFGEGNNSDTLEVYQSSVLRTSWLNDKNANGPGDTIYCYYHNMDTAYKFWETTIRGTTQRRLQDSRGNYMSAREAWYDSPSTVGERGPYIQSSSSVINYYDNTFVVPKGKEIEIYVRHVDITNLETVNSETIENENIIDVTNTQAIEHASDNWEALNAYKYPVANPDGTRNTNAGSDKFSEYYTKPILDTAWRFGNLKYAYNNAETGQYFSAVNPEAIEGINGYALSDIERDIRTNYNCIGAVVGKGEDIDKAIENRNDKLNGINIRTVEDDNGQYMNNTSGVIKGTDWSSVVVQGNESNPVIVIDFYYEKKPTQVYVRHIDVTDKTNIGYIYNDTSDVSFLQTSVGKAFLINQADWNISTGSVNPVRRNQIPDGSVYEYQEVFEKNSGTGPLRIANIKYDHETGGSYWDLLNSSKKETYGDYICVGSAVGKGDRVDLAEVKRDEATKNAFNNNLIDFVNFKNGDILQSEDSYVDRNYNYTSVTIPDNNYNAIVVDFYYIKEDDPTIIDPPGGSGKKYVYVRHIDITGINNINSNSIDDAVRSGKTLNGRGVAKKNGSSRFNKNKDSGNYSGYQERYTINSNESLEVFRDPNDNYNCVGSNMTTTNDGNLTTVKNRMNSKLNGNSNKYDSWLTESRKTPSGNSADIIIMDFYYSSKHTGTPIERPKVGRLAFYSVSQSSQFANKVDNHTNTDTQAVYDVIPSSEVLRMSVDNAYTYMLGAINIKEQTIENTYSFDYTITQPYTVTYKDWSSSCSGQCEKTSSDKKEGACTNTYKYTYIGTCYDGEGGSYPCEKEATARCTGTWTATYKNITATGKVSRTYTYKIPYKYTYYKVKNMRMYTINKIELIDGYDNNGLPLFDGKTYTATTTDKYKDGFNDASFVKSSNKETNNRTSKTLSNRLYYTYNNENGDVRVSVPKGDSENKINTLLNNINHSDAAKIESFKGINSSAYNPTSTNLTATLYVKNDEISFKDGVKNQTIKLVGEDNNRSSTLNNTYTRSEKEATRKIDLSEYTKSKTTTKSGSKYVYTTTDSDKVDTATVYPKSVKNKYLPSDSKTNYGTYGGRDYYNLQNLTIPESRLNGKRYSYGKIYYTLLSGNNILNFDVNDSNVRNGNHNWNDGSKKKAVTGSGGNTFVDTEMYNNNGVASPSTTTLISAGTLKDEVWEYGDNNGTDADIVDVFTPISFTTKIIGNNSSDIRVDHTTENYNTNQQKQIQKNSRFTIQIDANNQNSTYPGIQTSKYLEQYYIKFDFDVQDIRITDARGTDRAYSSNSASSETWIGPIYNKYNGITKGTVTVSAYALADPNEATDVVNQEQNSYEVRAVAVNTPSSLEYDVLRGRISDTVTYIGSNGKNVFSGTGSNNQDHNKYYDQKNIFGHSNYVGKETVETENISRVYDFKVTDIKDVDWKNIFRKSTSTTTNVHSGKAYYSGIKKWNIYTTAYNDMVTRDVSEIGATKQQILPVGPYKHTTTTYTRAPKLGYKFSFDLKTTGANANKKIVITPSFYFIKKDATGYTEDIKLYYKNSSNKYVDISNYKLYFVPDDGYRLTFEGTDEGYRFSSSSISKSTVALGTTKNIELKSNMMEQADNNFVQIWYGEYKLPNSTIVIGKGTDGKYDINRDRLTGGYIGVKFDIKVWEYKDSSMTTISKKLSYSQNDKNASSNTNTSQWDYEGYLGFSNPGNSANNIRLPLEKGVWVLNNTMYNKIKGTVMLYDTDATASSDYD